MTCCVGSKWMVSTLLVCMFMARKVCARECVKCEDFSVSSSSGIFGSNNPFDGHSDPTCATRSYPTQSCNFGDYCGTVKGKITVKIPILGSFTSEMTVRECISDPGVGMGCHSYDDINQLLSDVLSFLVKLGAVTFEGQLCLSDGTSICPTNSLLLYPWLTKDLQCLHWGIIGGAGAALVLLLIGMCVCCCCCCCRTHRPRASAVQATMVPQVLTIQSTNPPYTRMEEPGREMDLKY